MFGVILSFAVIGAGFALIVAAGASISKKWSRSPVGWLSGGVVALAAAAFIVLAVTYFSVIAGAALTVLVLGASVIVVIRARPFRHWLRGVPIFLVVTGIAVTTVGLSSLRFTSPDPFAAAARRFVSWVLPVDNAIPALTATWFAGDQPSGFIVDDWLPSDRPPLQAGVILMARAIAVPLTTWGGFATIPQVDFAASVIAQLLWVPALIGFVVALGCSLRIAVTTAAFVGLIPGVVINTVFTWPKMLSAALVLVSMSCLIAGLRRAERSGPALLVAAIAASLALLAHGGALFVLPAILVLAVVLIVRMQRRWVWIGWATLAVSATYAPWLLFQRFVAPPGDRLLKWHLAGITDVNDSRGILGALIDQYSHVSLQGFWETRVSNLARAFDPRILEGLDFWNPQWIDRRLAAEFYETPAAMSIGAVAFLVAVSLWVVGVISKRHDPIEDRAMRVAGLLIACIGIWAVSLYSASSAVVHQGSQARLLALAAIGFATVARKSSVTAGVLFALQAVLSFSLLVTSPWDPGAPVRLWAVPLILVGGGLTAAGVLWRARASGGRLLPQS